MKRLFILMGMPGGTELLVLLLVPVAIFLIGYYFGKKSGYIKRVKEEDRKLK